MTQLSDRSRAGLCFLAGMVLAAGIAFVPPAHAQPTKPSIMDKPDILARHVFHPKAPVRSVAHVNKPRVISAGYGNPVPSTTTYIASGEPCTAPRSLAWSVPVRSWVAPPGCFGNIYTVNEWGYADSKAISGSYGWCNWWAEAISNNPFIRGVWHSLPVVGAIIHFAPGDQGAGSDGHWGYVESIGPNGWLLISEMNSYTPYGGGWEKVDYRYVRVDAGLTFIY